MSITKAAEVLQTQNKIIKSFPRGRLGLWQGRPRQYGHRPGADRDVRDGDQPQTGNRMAAGLTIDKLIAEMDKALQFPGVANSWTMPIKARIDMLSTGIRTPIGIKVFGKDLDGWSAWPRKSKPW